MALEPLLELLADVRDLAGAESAALWQVDLERDTAVLLHHAATDGAAPSLDSRTTGLLTWAAAQQPGELCTDGEVPRFAATPLAGAEPEPTVLALSGGAHPLGMRRDELRAWVPRFAARLESLRLLLDARVAANRAERHADLLLLTAAQLHEHRTVEDLGASLCSAALHMTGARRVALVRWLSTEQSGEVAFATRGHLVKPGWPVTRSSQTGLACANGNPLIVEKAAGSASGARQVYGGDEPERELGALVVIPLRSPGADAVIGALVIESDSATRVSAADAKNLRLLGLLGAAALETVWEIEEINRRARTDALTGLANRQTFEERLTRIVSETDRFGGCCALVLVDIDRFKHVNDTFGHQSGDSVLQQVAATLQKEVRTVDLLARYGGEEMAFLLPQTDLEGGMQLAERLRQAVCEHPYAVAGREVPITISLGVSAYPAGARSQDELFAAADRALYEAKRAGRNKVAADRA